MFLLFLLHFKHLNVKCLSLAFMYWRQDLQSLHLLLWSSSARLSARQHGELDINLKLSINIILYVVVLSFAVSLLVLKHFYTFLCSL